MAESNQQYWKRRAKNLDDAVEKAENEVIKELGEIFTYARQELIEDINAFYNMFAYQNEMTLQDAIQKLSQTDIRNFQREIDRLQRRNDLTPQQEEHLELLRGKTRLTRMHLLISKLDLQLIDIYGDVQVTMEEHLAKVAQESYQEANAMMGEFARLPIEDIRFIINNPWSGEMFSDRLWRHKDKLVRNLNNVIRSGLIRGDSIPNMTKQLQKQVGNSEFASERLIRTESNFVMTETTARGYEDNGLEKYQFIAHDDEKTCIPCNRLDNQVFLLSERQQGLNIPPIHPLDRCLIIPYVE